MASELFPAPAGARNRRRASQRRARRRLCPFRTPGPLNLYAACRNPSVEGGLQTAEKDLAGPEEAIMDSIRNYHQLALDCLNLAQAARDPAIQDRILRMAELWARLADRSEEKVRLHPAYQSIGVRQSGSC
jgi:hypothetical protein